MKSLGIDIGSSSVKVSLLDIASGECAASSANPATEMPIGSAAERLGRAGPRNVVALRLRRHSNHCGAGLRDERRGVGGHHLPDARTGLSRQAGPSAAPLDHLVRLARRGDRSRSAGRHRAGVLSRAYAQLTGQLHCVETGVGQAQRTRRIRADIQIHAPRRLHRLPPFGTHVHLRQRPFGADTLGLRRGAGGPTSWPDGTAFRRR